MHTGDITDDGSINAYLHAKEILDKLTTKYFLVCGNHDNFDNLKQVFNNHNYFVDGEFAHYAIDDLSLRIIVIDTSVKGKDFGWLCDVRKKLLIDALRSSKKDTIIFLHHFPIIVKDTLFNEINLINNVELENIILKHSHVLGLYCGHSHYGAAGLFAKKMCWISPSTAPIHIIKNSKCEGLRLSAPCYSLHHYMKGKINSFVISVEDCLESINFIHL